MTEIIRMQEKIEEFHSRTESKRYFLEEKQEYLKRNFLKV